MLTERRRSAFPTDLFVRVGIAWATISALLLVVNWGAISTMRFPDPDDTMRLVQVRDLLNGQGWFDVRQYRVDAPGAGVLMHWSRIVDLPLALAILILTPVLGAASAESAALVITPLIALGAAMLLAARIAWRLLGDQETLFTALVLAACVPVIFQLGPMRIDHHGWQMVCALAAMNGLMARCAVVGGRVIGVSLATWLMISIEGLPLAAVIYAVLALRWLRDPKQRVWLVNAIQGLAVACTGLFVLTRGLGDLSTYCDAISPLHMAMFVWGALVLSLLGRAEPIPFALRLGGFAVAGGGALALLLYSAPQCATGGGFSELDPLVHDYWYINVKEGMPIWRQTLTVALQYAVTPLIGLYAAIRLALRSHDWLRQFWIDYAIILGASFVISLLVARAGAVACLIAAPPLAWQVHRWLRAVRHIDRPFPRAGALLTIGCALLPTLPLTIAGLIAPAQARIENPALAHQKMSDCRIEQSAAILDTLEPGEIFAPLDIAPTLLMVSHHSVLATGHHRGNETMRLVIHIALGSAEEAQAALQARGTRYLALCPNLDEPRNYVFAAPRGLTADLLEGRTPDWLEPIETAPGTTFQLWRIARTEQEQVARSVLASGLMPG